MEERNLRKVLVGTVQLKLVKNIKNMENSLRKHIN